MFMLLENCIYHKSSKYTRKKKKLFTLLKKEIETKMMLWITTGITDEAWHT